MALPLVARIGSRLASSPKVVNSLRGAAYPTPLGVSLSGSQEALEHAVGVDIPEVTPTGIIGSNLFHTMKDLSGLRFTKEGREKAEQEAQLKRQKTIDDFFARHYNRQKTIDDYLARHYNR